MLLQLVPLNDINYHQAKSFNKVIFIGMIIFGDKSVYAAFMTKKAISWHVLNKSVPQDYVSQSCLFDFIHYF
jgi:hypothetical protein